MSASRSVAVTVVVSAAGGRSAAGPAASLRYSNVPAYFACLNAGQGSAGVNSCFSCCRSACIVDQFAQGGANAGGTFSLCDMTCSGFCNPTH